MMRTHWGSVLLAMCLAMPLVGCGGSSDERETSGGASSAGGGAAAQATSEWPDEIAIGYIPSESKDEMAHRFEELWEYLRDTLGVEVEVFQATSYRAVIEAMKNEKVDVAFLGGFSYTLAEDMANAEAIAVTLDETGSTTYKSLIIVPADSPAQSLADLQGQSIAFVDPASTSGCLVPSFMVQQETGLMPEDFFSDVTFAKGHDAVNMQVHNKAVAAGGTNDITYNDLIASGTITPGSVRILMESDPIPGVPVAVRGDLPEDLKDAIQTALLEAHEHIENVGGYGGGRFVEAAPEDYTVIREIRNELGMTPDTMPD